MVSPSRRRGAPRPGNGSLRRYATGVLPPSGEPVTLTRAELTALVTGVGATLRSFRSHGEPVVWEFEEDEIATGGRGQVLAPWPNRLEDGSYRFGDVEGRAALDEPERSNAIHGLVRWQAWTLERRSPSAARWSYVVQAQPAFPFRVRLEIEYRLTDEGLVVECSAENTGATALPFGLGFHPYLVAGAAGLDRVEIDLAADTHLICSDRGLPVGSEPVAGSAFDLRARSLAGVVLDDCFTDLTTGSDGRWRASLAVRGEGDGDGEGARPGDRAGPVLWADGSFAYVMCYTGDTLESPADRRRAIAVEPMTCPPNALRTGESLVVLAPGERWAASWGIEPGTMPRGNRERLREL